MIPEILDLQVQFRAQRQPYVVATVVEILGSSSAKPAAKALFDSDGKVIFGWVGGGCAQSMVSQAAVSALQSGEVQMLEIDLNDEIFGAGMPCGGTMRVYIEPVLPKPVLWLVGHGRIVETLCNFATTVGFEVHVNDAQASPDRFPQARNIITDDYRYQKLLPQGGDFVVIATHHKGDYDSLTQVLVSNASYIGLVSSYKRANLVRTRLAQEGFTELQLSRIRAPAGLDLAARLPEEIALAVMAEIVAIRRGGSAKPLCVDPV